MRPSPSITHPERKATTTPPTEKALIASSYRQFLEQLDSWHQAARAQHPGLIPCRAGCTACCHGPFDISVADALLLRVGLETLNSSELAEIDERASLVMAEFRRRAPGWGPPYDIADLGEERFDQIVEALADVPCPLLDDAGRCRLYEHRPATCRLMGLAAVSESGQVLENECPIQGQFPAYQALSPIPLELEGFHSEEYAHLEAAALALFQSPFQAEYATIVAAALSASPRESVPAPPRPPHPPPGSLPT